MRTIKQIPHPEFNSARRLTPLQMNGIKCQRKHTVLTPEQLDRMAQSKTQPATGTISQ